MVRDRVVRPVRDSRMIAHTTKCARRADQRGAMSSFLNNDYVGRRIPFRQLSWLISSVEQVETLLKSQDAPDTSKDASRRDSTSAYVASTIQQTLPNSNDIPNPANTTQGGLHGTGISGTNPFQQASAGGNNGEADFSWEMIGLGLEEPLPPQDVMDDLWVKRILLNVCPLTLWPGTKSTLARYISPCRSSIDHVFSPP